MAPPSNEKEIFKFDPFQNRLCRDVRNELSESLIKTLREGDIGPSQAVAEIFLKKNPPQVVCDYMKDRIARYDAVLSQLRASDMERADAYGVSLFLWNQGLFFEVHEVLEEKWHQSKGSQRKVLQAFIRAAGTYVHLEQDRMVSAQKMSQKAIAGLLEYKVEASKLADVDVLVSALERLDPMPPKLAK